MREPTCINKWKECYPHFLEVDVNIWSNIFKQAFTITRETALQTFQYKIIHRLIVCQKKLWDMKLVDSPVCLYCNKIDDLRHFFIFCEKSNQFWNSFFNWWNSLGDIKISDDCDSLEECVLFGFQIEGGIFSVLNYCILLAKNYIYNQRLHNDNDIDFYQYLIILRYKLKIEKNICCCNNSLNDFEKFMFLYEQL